MNELKVELRKRGLRPAPSEGREQLLARLLEWASSAAAAAVDEGTSPKKSLSRASSSTVSAASLRSSQKRKKELESNDAEGNGATDGAEDATATAKKAKVADDEDGVVDEEAPAKAKKVARLLDESIASIVSSMIILDRYSAAIISYALSM